MQCKSTLTSAFDDDRQSYCCNEQQGSTNHNEEFSINKSTQSKRMAIMSNRQLLAVPDVEEDLVRFLESPPTSPIPDQWHLQREDAPIPVSLAAPMYEFSLDASSASVDLGNRSTVRVNSQVEEQDQFKIYHQGQYHFGDCNPHIAVDLYTEKE